MASRAPHGARGLKLKIRECLHSEIRSRPARGAWIETARINQLLFAPASRPARGAWIETVSRDLQKLLVGVAPRTGRVD